MNISVEQIIQNLEQKGFEIKMESGKFVVQKDKQTASFLDTNSPQTFLERIGWMK